MKANDLYRGKKESVLEKDAKKFMKSRGWTVHKMKFLDVNGAPDDFCVRTGKIVLAEFKRADDDKGPTVEQQIIHAELRLAGVTVEVISSIERAYEVFY
jgi:hypothetical protein